MLAGRVEAERCELEDPVLAWCIRTAALELLAEAAEEAAAKSAPRG